MSSITINSFAVVGAGAIGSYYGVRLALAGADVRFLLRSDLAVVRERGFTLRESDGTRQLARPAVFASAAEIGPVDVVLVTLKATANAVLPELLPPLLGERTLVVTLQNGLGNEEFLGSLVGAERVFGGLCFIAVTREGPGELVGFHTPGAMTLGEVGRTAGERTHALADWFQRAGVKCRAVDSLAEARWRKLIWNIPFNGLAIAAGGITTDRILADATLTSEVRALMDEVADAGRGLGYVIPEKFIQNQIDITPPMGPYKPSSLVDYLAGRDVEVEPIWGEPLRRAQAAGFPMPRLSALYSRLSELTSRRE